MMKLFSTTHKTLNACLFVVLFYSIVVTTTTSQQTKYRNFAFPAVIVFGDSVMDTGNNDYVRTLVKANFKPYGRDFIGGKATGRFSNGKIPADILAEILGVKETLPPYLDPNLKIQDLLTGVCFASAGSGFDPITVELTSVLSVEDQLNMFKEYIGKLKAVVGEARTTLILAKSMFFIYMGSNDISSTYFLFPFRRYEHNVEEYTSMLVHSSSKFLQELYKFGARRIGVVGLSPLGCLPLQRILLGGEERNCVESINQAVTIYNSKLSCAIMALNKSLPEARLIYLDNYSKFSELIQPHNQFGFEVVDSSCCGSAEGGFLCNSFSLQICKNATKYVFWDGVHPTEKAYKILVSDMIAKNIDKFL